MTKLAFTLSHKNTTRLQSIARRYGIELIILFGSRARGDARRDSDLDVGVLFERMPSPRRFAALEARLLNLLKDDVHLVPLNFVNPELRVAAAQEGKILFERAAGIYAGFLVENLHRLHQYYYLRQYDRDFLTRFLGDAPNDQNLHNHRRTTYSRKHRRMSHATQRS